jgi:DNA-binding NarL/FixJ family response regulator
VPEPIRVLLVDDHALVREGLRTFLELQDGIEVAGEAGDGEEAVAVALRTRPDVVLMDLVMPRLDGVGAMRQLRELVPGARVIVLTSFTDDDRLLPAIRAGAAGYLLKDAEPEALTEGIRAAARDESPLHPRAARALLEARERPRRAELTPREHEVLALVGEGLPNKTIARRMHISEKTVKAHLTRVFAAIGVTDRTSAALWAREHGVR